MGIKEMEQHEKGLRLVVPEHIQGSVHTLVSSAIPAVSCFLEVIFLKSGLQSKMRGQVVIVDNGNGCDLTVGIGQYSALTGKLSAHLGLPQGAVFVECQYWDDTAGWQFFFGTCPNTPENGNIGLNSPTSELERRGKGTL